MRRPLWLACLTLALASVPALPTVARADDAAVAEAKARFEEGLELADTGKHEQARLKFQQAWSVFKAPAVLYNLARSEQLTGHDLEALEHFRLFAKVSATDAKITDAMREKAKQNAAELSAKVAQVDIEVPATARVTVDGKALEESPPKDPVPVQPGKHRVEATFEGKLKSVTVECAAGSIVKAKIIFEPGGTTEPPPVSGTEPNSVGYIVPIALGVVGLAGLGLGIGFSAKSQSNKTDSEKLRTDNPGLCANPPLDACATYDSKRDSAKSAATVGTIGYIAGGTLLAAAVVTFIVLPKTKEKSASTSRGLKVGSVQPLIGSGSYGAGVAGQF